MPEDDVRVPAGWYPDPLGLPQLRWWDNHAWTEHISDARQPMMATETVTSKLAFADEDRPSTERPFADLAADEAEAEQELSRRERRERDREFDDLPEADTAGDRDSIPPAAAAFADPLRSLEAPERDQVSVEEASPAFRLAASGRLDEAPTSAPFEMDTRFDDLLGESSEPRSAFAHVSESAASFIPTTPPEQQWPTQQWQSETPRGRALTDAPTSTGPAWIMTLIPLYTLVVGLLLLLSGTAQVPSAVVLVFMFGLPYLAGIVLAVLDYRALRRGGMEQPAHWAWAFLTVGIYLVARLTRTVRESGTVLACEAQVGLVHQRRGLERVVRPLAGHVLVRELPEFLVDEARHLLQGSAVTLAPGRQESRDVRGGDRFCSPLSLFRVRTALKPSQSDRGA